MKIIKNYYIGTYILFILLLLAGNNTITGIQSQNQFIISFKDQDISDSIDIDENYPFNSKISGIQITETDFPNYQLNNTILTEPLVLMNCPNAQIVNVTIVNITEPELAVISLNNCSNSLIQNVTIRNITTTDSYVSGISILDSDNTSIINTTIDDVISTASGFLHSKKAYGIIVNGSEDVDIYDVIIDNITAISTSYGIFSENSASLFVNHSSISKITAESALGIFLDNSLFSEIRSNRLTNLFASTSKSVGIFLSDSLLSTIIQNDISIINGNSFVCGIDVFNTNSISIINNSVDTLTSLSYLDLIAGIKVRNSDFALVKSNNITKIQAANFEAIGIIITDGFSPDLVNNSIEDIFSASDSVYGITVDYCESTLVVDNNISNIWSSADTYSIPPSISETTGYGLNIKHSNLATISYNNINSTKVWISADESSSPLTYTNNTINSIRSEINELDRPGDQVIEEMQTKMIEWEVSSNAQYYNYSVYKDGGIYKNSTYVFLSDFTINVEIKDLSVGVFNFLLVLQEDNGILMTDFVTITVSESDIPIFISKPNATLYYQVGSTQEFLLEWTVNDSNPDTYSIYQNGTEISYKSWEALNPFNISVGGLPLGIYNITIIIQDIAQNSITDQVSIHVIPHGAISITRNTADLVEFEIFSESCVLNWTVHSIEGGTYSIYRGSNKEEKITSASFSPEEPIIYVIPPDTPIGTHIYSLEIIDTLGNTVFDLVSVKITSNPTNIESTTTRATFTAPPYTIPLYLSTPAPEFPWPLVIGTFGGLSLAAIAFFVLTKRILVPKAIKENRKGLSRARKIKDKAGVANRLHQLGQTFLEMKDYKASIKHNEEALELFTKLGDKKGQLAALEGLGDAYQIRGVEKKND